jgi:hypothetical protein
MRDKQKIRQAQERYREKNREMLAEKTHSYRERTHKIAEIHNKYAKLMLPALDTPDIKLVFERESTGDLLKDLEDISRASRFFGEYAAALQVVLFAVLKTRFLDDLDEITRIYENAYQEWQKCRTKLKEA